MPEKATIDSIARSVDLPAQGVHAVVFLLEDGNTLPFIARYRKEATGGIDEVGIGLVMDAWAAAQALDKRKETIVKAISASGAMTAELQRQIAGCTDKDKLEDLYLPFKKKRKTRAAKARELGLEPLARRILEQSRDGSPQQEAARYMGGDHAAALAGARDIVAERVAEDRQIRVRLRDLMGRHGNFESKAIKKATEGKRTPFEDYYDFHQPLGRLPSHRVMALSRGEAEGVLRVNIRINEQRTLDELFRVARVHRTSPWEGQFREAITDGYKRLLHPSIENEIRRDLKEKAELESVAVFEANLQALLLAAPFGARSVIGIDPGLRTGCKCAVLDAGGKYLKNITIYPHTGGADRAAHDLVGLVQAHQPAAIAIGNGTGGRETMAFVQKTLRSQTLDSIVVMVNEAGASVYSASEIARDEFPDLDLTVRGAISIGRRLQDPLAELVKVDPRSIGVGQYQHDIAPSLLQERLQRVVQRCVNSVGVQLNTASAALLENVAGIGPVTAKRIVTHRDKHGRFESRREVIKVPGLGQKTFEQAAGFLRIAGAKNPLDDSAVHPERYVLVRKMAKDLGTDLSRLVGNAQLVSNIEANRYVSDDVGRLTLQDILAEIARPGRDPRAEFEPPRFREGVDNIDDLEVGMVLEGVVTNVTAFGAFVDIGVHQDGLVHVSKLANRFVQDPHEVVKAGQRLDVRVMSIDLERKRISLSVRDVE